MIEGTKIRGRDDGENFILINSVFYKCTADLVSFEFHVCPEDVNDIKYIGYSKPLKQLYVQFRNDKRYIYQNVSLDKWQLRYSYDNVSRYYREEIQGIGYYETEEFLKQIPNEYILDAYNKLEYYHTVTSGMWATDVPEKVIDPENVLMQI
jgi:hypothetical protein